MKKFLFDLFPLILFFVAYKINGMYFATAVAIAAGIAQLIWLKLTKKPIESMHWINLGVIVVFGGATLWLQDDTFIKWKPTVLYWIFGGSLLIGQIALKRNLMQKLLGEKIVMSPQTWSKMNLSWGIFFVCAGIANLFVAFSGHFTLDQWVNFKVFGLMGLLIVFVIGQSIWLGKHMQPVSDEPTDQP